MKNHCSSFAVGLLLLGFAGCFGGSTPPPIEIGHVSDKTRADKAGDQAELGLRLALSELSKDETLAESFAGRKIQIRHTDTQGKLDAFEAEAVRLESVSRVTALFGGLSTAESAGLGNAKIPILTFHGQPTAAAGDHVFYLGMTPSRQGTVLAKVVAEDAKAMRIILLKDEQRTEAAGFAESFQKSLDETRKQANAEAAVVLTLRYTREAKSKDALEGIKWNELVERINVQKPHVIVFAGSVRDFNAWHRVFRKEGKAGQAQIVFAGNDGDQRQFDFEGDDKVSVVLASAFHVDSKSDKISAFRKAFREAYQIEADVNAALAYDGLRILVEAMKATRTQLTLKELREKLLETKAFEGVTGPLTINADRQVERPLHVLRWQNGTLTLMKTIGP